MKKAIKWFKGTITGKNLYSKGNEGYKDFEVALKIAKKEVFDDLDKVIGLGSFHQRVNLYNKLKNNI